MRYFLEGTDITHLLHVTVGVGKPAVKHLKLTVLPTSMSLASIGGMVMVAGTETEQVYS